jgi:hypothetical protein
VTVAAGGATDAAHAVLATSLGELTVVREEGVLTGLHFPRHWPRPDRTAFGDVARQLGEYLDGARRAFELPLKVRGTEFDRRVWNLIAAVPYGETSAAAGRRLHARRCGDHRGGRTTDGAGRQADLALRHPSLRLRILDEKPVAGAVALARRLLTSSAAL